MKSNHWDYFVYHLELSFQRLSYDLKLPVPPKESEMIVVMETELWPHSLTLCDHNQLFFKRGIKTTLKAFTFNYLDLVYKLYIQDKNFFDVLQKQREKSDIRKPIKGNVLF